MQLQNEEGQLLDSVRFASVDVTPDKRFVVTPEGAWDVKEKALVRRFAPTGLYSHVVTPDGQRMIAAARNAIYFAPLLVCQPGSSEEEREQLKVRAWTDATSGRTLDATLVDFKQNFVLLQTTDNRRISIPVSRLSQDDPRLCQAACTPVGIRLTSSGWVARELAAVSLCKPVERRTPCYSMMTSVLVCSTILFAPTDAHQLSLMGDSIRAKSINGSRC